MAFTSRNPSGLEMAEAMASHYEIAKSQSCAAYSFLSLMEGTTHAYVHEGLGLHDVMPLMAMFKALDIPVEVRLRDKDFRTVSVVAAVNQALFDEISAQLPASFREGELLCSTAGRSRQNLIS
jgi:fructose-1,6-bisphosphatase/inositol monophosphatase family enzyme